MVCVPIWLGNRVVAALQLINRLPDPDDATRPRRFTQEDEAWCESLGAVAMSCIQALRLAQGECRLGDIKGELTDAEKGEATGGAVVVSDPEGEVGQVPETDAATEEAQHRQRSNPVAVKEIPGERELWESMSRGAHAEVAAVGIPGEREFWAQMSRGAHAEAMARSTS